MDDFKQALKTKMLESLKSAVATDRYKAAGYFSTNPCIDAESSIRSQRRVERVRHVKMALDSALRSIEKLVIKNGNCTENTDKSNDDKSLKKYFKSQAVDEITGVLLHELAPKLGMLKVSMSSELNNYAESKSKKHLDSLDKIFSAIENLRISAQKPESKDIDLAQFIKDIVAAEVKSDVVINYEGEQPCVIRVDPGLLEIAFCNGIRNAYESVIQVDNPDRKNIVISWGVNDVDYWICVIDEGLGLKGEPKDAFKIGNTNKPGHTGFGMGIMNQAMDNLGGIVELSNVNSGGAKLVLRWGDFDA